MINIKEYLEENPQTGRRKLAKLFNISETKARKIVKEFKENKLEEETHDDLLKKTVDLELTKQRLLDERRIERKIREEYRKTSHLKELTDELINCFTDYKIPEITTHKSKNNEYTGIVHLSDFHLNEIVNFKHNKYDFDVASKRLQKFVYHIKKHFKMYGIKNILIAATGDLFSAMKHQDQMISMATSRAQAVFVGATLIEQMILDLNQDFNISVAFVAGNESRETSLVNIPSTTMLLSDNLDITLFSMLKLMFRDTDVKFLETNVIDCMVNIQNKNFLFTHGHTFSHGNLQKSISELKGKYAARDIIIDYVCFGHIHNSHNSPDGGFFRSGSLIGDNAYSYNALNFCGRASQNLYIVGQDETIGVTIDLQEYTDFNGYEFDKTLIENQKINETNTIDVIKL